MDKYIIEIHYEGDETTFKITKSSNVLKLRNFIEMYYEDLKTSFYKIIYNGRNITEEENIFNVPLSNIFGDVQIVNLKIIKSIEEDLLHIKWKFKCIFKNKSKMFEMIPLLNFEKFKFNILSFFPELEQENYTIIYNKIDITNIYSNNTLLKDIFGENVAPVETVTKFENITESKLINQKDSDFIIINIESQPKTIIKFYKICSFCHLIIANYVCNKCAIASCEKCSPKDKHIKNKERNLVRIEQFRDCDYSYESTTLQSYLNKLEEYMQKATINKTDNFLSDKKEKMLLLKSKFEEIHRLIDKIKEVQISNLEALLERIARKYSPNKFIPNYQELYNKIYKYKQNPFFDVEESMKKIIEFGLLLKRLMEEFDNFLKDYLEFYSKYKKCLEIIHQIIRFLENALIESKIIFKNDIDVFQYKKLLKIYDSSHVLVYDHNINKFQMMNFHDEKNLFKENFNNYVQANFNLGPEEKLFIITGSTSQKFFVYDLNSNEMQFVSQTKFSHNWWPSIIPYKKEDKNKIQLVLFCLGGSYTNKCEILFFKDKLKKIEEKKEENEEQKENEEKKEDEEKKEEEKKEEEKKEENNAENNEEDVNMSAEGEVINVPEDDNVQEGDEIIDDKIIPLKWYQIASTGVNHGQAGSFIINNKYLFLLFGYDYNLKPITKIEKINIESIVDNPISQAKNVKWKVLDFKNPDKISSILYYNSILKKNENEVFILGGLKEIGQVDCIYKYSPKQNILSKTENIIPFKYVRFQNEKNFYLINKLSDLEDDNLIKYKDKNEKTIVGEGEKEKESLLDKEVEIKNKIKGIHKSREFAIIDANNQVHIIKGETFEHFSLDYIPTQ